MDYCIVNKESNIIENMIVCENDEIAKEFDALPSYEGAGIGQEYAPVQPAHEPTKEEDIDAMLIDHECRLAQLELEKAQKVEA